MAGVAHEQFAEPAVSRAKFDAEVAAFTELRGEYERRGWFLVDATFPTVFVILATPNVRPAALVCGVVLDYTNYDAQPPSVRLVDPFTRKPYRQRELPVHLNRAMPVQSVQLPGLPPGGGLQVQGVQPLMQAHDVDEVPFLCIAGVREYHEHPGHSGDAWELHRTGGAGRLVRLLEVISRYGVEPVTGYTVQLRPEVGLEFGQPPA